MKKFLPLLALITLANYAISNRAMANSSDLPDIGLSASAKISSTQEYQIGRAIMRDLHAQGAIINDPELTAYIQSIGNNIAIHAHEGEQRFTFFVINDPQINAFALPGGFIGVHTGLITATVNENELAGVLAHEIAHVSQKHIARMIEANGQSNLLTTAATLAALLIGGLSGADGNAISAAVSVAQGTAMQRQINFTRDNEYEADRIGIEFLNDAGFDPMGMPTFFQTMGKRSGLAGTHVPEFFRTHPISSNRIAESRNRAEQLPRRSVPSSTGYNLAKARLAVLSGDSATDALQSIEARIEGHPSEERDDLQYAYGLALKRAGRSGQALELIGPLYQQNQSIVAYHILFAETLIADGQTKPGLKQFNLSQTLFPRNIALTMSHSNALLQSGEPDKARKLMLDLVNNVDYTTEQLRLLAMAASSAGYNGDAHYYMSEFHVLNGELDLAVNQLKMALKSPDIRDYQYARIDSRLELIEAALIRNRKSNRARRRSEEREE